MIMDKWTILLRSWFLLSMLNWSEKKSAKPVADPGFSPGGGANSQNCYYFSHFCRKLHENERIWTPRGGARVPGAPPWIRQCKRPLSHVSGCSSFIARELENNGGKTRTLPFDWQLYLDRHSHCDGGEKCLILNFRFVLEFRYLNNNYFIELANSRL